MDQLMKRWVITSLITLCVLILIAIGLLPTILSSDGGKAFIERQIENSMGGRVSIGDLSLSWTGEQRIDKFSLDDQKGFRFGFDELTSDCSFWSILFRSGSVGETYIASPWIAMQAKPIVPKTRREEQVLKEKKKAKSLWSDYSGKLTLDNGRMDVTSGGRSLMRMEGLKLEFDAPKSSKLYSIIAQGQTRQNDLQGSFNINTKVSRWIEGVATVSNFPVGGLDQMIGVFKPTYQGFLLAALGDTLNLNLKADASGSSQRMDLGVRSPRLLVDLNGNFQDKLLTLTEAGRIAWTVKPEIFNFFVKKVQLQSDAQIELRLSSATLPMTKRGLNWSDLAAQGNLYFSGGNLFLEEIKQAVGINELSADFQTKKLQDSLALTFRSTMRYNASSEGQVSGSAMIQNFLEKNRSFPRYDLKIDNLPLALIDTWKKSEYVKYLGQNISGRLMKSSEAMVISARTPLLQLQEAELTITDVARLIQPTTLSYVLGPNIYDQLIRPITLGGQVNSLSVPIEGGRLNFASMDFDMNVTGQNMGLQNLFALGSATLPFINLDLKGKGIEDVQFVGTSRLDFSPKTWGLSLIGSEVGVKTSGRFSWDDELEASPFLMQFDGRKFKSTLEAAIEKSALILKKPLKIDFLLEPDQINSILSKESEYPLLSKPTPFQLEIKPSRLPLKETAFDSLAIKGSGTIDNLAMYSPKSGFPFNFKDVKVDFDLDGKKKQQMIRFDAHALENGKEAGSLGLELNSSEGAKSLIQSPSNVKATLKDFSSQIADVFLGTRGQLPDMIGPTLNLNYQLAKQSDRENIDLKINSRDLDLDGSFSASDKFELRSSRKPLKIRWTLSEKSYDAFQRWRKPGVPETPNNLLFEIDGSSQLKIQVAPLVMPLKKSTGGFPKVDLNLYRSLFDANIRIDDLTLKQGRTGDLTKLNRFDLDIDKKSLGNMPMAFKFNGNVQPHAKGGSGRIKGNGKLENFLSPEGNLDLSNVTTEIHADIKNLPSIFLDALSRLDKDGGYPPSAFLGDLFNATFDADIQKSQGTVSMDIDATGCRATFSGTVSDGVIYLLEPLKAAFTVTPELNRILERSAKLVVAAMEKPIILFISPKGFAVPLKNLHIRNMNFNYGQLDLGQILCKNVGSANDVSTLFKTEGDKNTSFWFAPMEFNVRQGNMYVDRTEILYNHAYQVCLWGDINFVRRYVDMTLGLTAQALASALGIGGLDSDYVLKVPVEGPFNNIDIDTGAATGKIAFLVARKQIAPQAGIWGQVFGAIGDLADDQSDVPPPKPPFPWQKN